jgi:hypothetical protein
MTDGWGLGSSVHAAASSETQSRFELSDRPPGMVPPTERPREQEIEQEILQLFFAVARARKKMDARRVRQQDNS